MTTSEENYRSIPSLDGLRALSVFAVILGHTRSMLLDHIPFNASFRNGRQGVAVFFGISGFLITHLLLKELRREGQINLKRFYLRRTMRIFPPFYVYLLVVLILSLLHEVHVNAGSMIAAATYTWNYAPVPGVWALSHDWVLSHCWSLTVEEQFYLFWPACMAFFSRRVNLRIAAGVILLSPLSRVATHYALPSLRGHMGMLHTNLDTIMTGCLLSLMIDMKLWPKFRRLAFHSAAPIAAIIFLLAVDTPAERHWKNMYTETVGLSLENLAIAILLLYVVFRSESPLGKILNLKLLRHLGMISYSLYLWQQLFTGPYTRLFPLNILWIFACAELSYLLVERPSFRIREWLQQRLSPARIFSRELVGVPMK
jgi:peptidoglycan/LPS O-acetylase OafA/YrhL